MKKFVIISEGNTLYFVGILTLTEEQATEIVNKIQSLGCYISVTNQPE